MPKLNEKFAMDATIDTAVIGGALIVANMFIVPLASGYAPGLIQAISFQAAIPSFIGLFVGVAIAKYVRPMLKL